MPEANNPSQPVNPQNSAQPAAVPATPPVSVASQVTQQPQQAFVKPQQVLSQAASILTGKPAQPQPHVTSDEKIWGALSYVPMVALLPLLLKPQSDFIKLHGRQGLLIFGIFFATIFLYIILPPLGAILGGMIQLALFVVGIYSFVQAFMGNWWKIPVLGDIAEKLPIEAFTKATTVAITGQPPATPPVEEQASAAQEPPTSPAA